MRVVVGVHIGGVFVERHVLDLEVGLADARKGHPVVVALVEILKVHVVGVGILIFEFGGIIIYNKIKRTNKGNPSGISMRMAYLC